MKVQRMITGLIGFPIVALILILGNKYLIDIVFAIVAMLGMNEYFNALKNKAKPVTWLGYLSCILIAFIHVIPSQYLLGVIGAMVPITVLILFLQIIFTNMKTNVTDAAVTLFGIAYIAIFILFIPLLLESENGKLLVWYIIFASWGTDTFAYLVGVKFGKHKISKISPKKSIEGSIGGTLAAILLSVGYTVFLNIHFNMGINYIYIAVISLILSLISQIGDFSASTIKRYAGIKDFSNLIPRSWRNVR